ncbi:4'-phosphopantetheinyl transferase family protein [Bacillus cereus]|uniref:4'-phosphopantetheinyl transferase family protein n=1 Tax=Bacillus cereus TaxID=1396 RepID=UPI00016B677B|nr:4'-phosphopantetheinyl transferase superfamily protein [Bacillus cereus]EDZ48987.1 4'-phosphopantetheinyl transferase, putative [Bacillus cereus AH1134]PEE96057.1 4'-phosphopantetheinyl transferase [Bacillus cereus]PGN73093.1 4'-phosphopantetheinyl transferase [Bacillus cereus]
MNRNIISLIDHQIFVDIKEFSIKDCNYLNEIELEAWNNKKKHLRNGKDWLVGRVAAKYSIARCLNIKSEEINQIYIQNRSNGAPYYLNGRKEDLVFSISHCNSVGFACSSASFSNIGCDIEKVRKRHPTFSNYYLSVAEEQIWIEKLENEDRDTILTIAWSCKEACFKCLTNSVEFSEAIRDIKIYPVVNHSFNFFYKNKKGLGYWDKYKGFIISIAVLF